MMAIVFKNQLFKQNFNLFIQRKNVLEGTKNIASAFYYKKVSFAKKQPTFYYKKELFENKKVPKHRKMPLFEKRSLNLAAKLDKRPKQKFNHFLVLDFEATCDAPANLDPQEIIEFPVLKVNSDSFKIESTFHSYVRPEINPEITPFCTELTGVIQSMVEDQPVFITVFENFLKWLEAEDILKPDNKFAFVTCGDPDLDYLLPLQCYLSNIEVPDFMKHWINIKRSFCEISPYTWPDNLVAMLKMCELEHTGDLHSGIDDAKNIARVMTDLADRGLVYDINGWKKSHADDELL